MATMLRTAKGKKIAYAILGIPANMQKAKKYRRKQLNTEKLLT